MSKGSRILFGLLVCLCALLAYGQKTSNSGSEREISAGKLAAVRGNYKEAVAHFSAANQLAGNKCSECYVWLARIAMAGGDLDGALAEIEEAAAAASTGPERASAELYRGVVLTRRGDLADAEEAFKAASAANPQCTECRFDLGFLLLKESKDSEGVAVLKTVMPRFAGTPRGREIQRFIADPSRIRKNYAPEFSAKLRTGEEINLDALKGKVVLLDFWGIWCTACREALPQLQNLAATADPARVAIISVDEGDPQPKWAQYIRDNAMNWLQVYDADRSLYRSFGVDGFPRYYILSKDGIILDEFKGWSRNAAADISSAITRALQ